LVIQGANAIPDLLQIIYSSQPFGFDDSIIGSILLDARRCNTRDDITGALVCRRDVYLQFLEGPAPAVQAAFARIARDDRHLDIKMLLSEMVPQRLFPDWAMLHDPATSWIWSPAEIQDDILDRVKPEELRAVFTTLAARAKTA
jgi:hypothetical protein